MWRLYAKALGRVLFLKPLHAGSSVLYQQILFGFRCIRLRWLYIVATCVVSYLGLLFIGADIQSIFSRNLILFMGVCVSIGFLSIVAGIQSIGSGNLILFVGVCLGIRMLVGKYLSWTPVALHFWISFLVILVVWIPYRIWGIHAVYSPQTLHTLWATPIELHMWGIGNFFEGEPIQYGSKSLALTRWGLGYLTVELFPPMIWGIYLLGHRAMRALHRGFESELLHLTPSAHARAQLIRHRQYRHPSGAPTDAT